jgi:hypothetical protein
MRIFLFLILFASFILDGCSADGDSSRGSNVERSNVTSTSPRSVETLDYGREICAWSGKLIETTRYGARIVLGNGDVLSFRSAEAMAAYYLGSVNKADIRQLLAVDFVDGKQLMSVDELVFLHSRLRPSPDGKFITAVDASNTKMKVNVYDAYPGKYLSWDELLDLVRLEGVARADVAVSRK